MNTNTDNRQPNPDIGANPLVRYLDKPPRDFTGNDLVRYATASGIRMVNLCYAGGDGRLKQLNFAIKDKNHLVDILEHGERVDGSSLFPYIETSSSDLYVIPRYRTAFADSMADLPTLNLLCSYFDESGNPAPIAPEHIVSAAHNSFRSISNLELRALGELEYYVIWPPNEQSRELYPCETQGGYHESLPFAKGEHIRLEMLAGLVQAGVNVKYGHAEVGSICADDGTRMPQHEIELQLAPIEEMADQICMSKWLMRRIAYSHGAEVVFAPKLKLGHAGNGMHIHIAAFSDDTRNAMLEAGGQLSDDAKRIMAGILSSAKSLTAFANRVPTSFLRLVPNQEAPVKICWGERNRSALVRVPLGWTADVDMVAAANPKETASRELAVGSKQTVEMRSPDATAHAHYLLAGMAMAARKGFTMEGALAFSDSLHIDVDIFADENADLRDRLDDLPHSCQEAGQSLLDDRQVYEEGDVFPPELIDGVARSLFEHSDEDRLIAEANQPEELERLVTRYIHYG